MKISEKCCIELKKKPFHKWQKSHNKTVVITGMRKIEGGQRTGLNCIVKDKDGHIIKFHPLGKVDDDWEQWFIDTYHIELCKLYYPPFNFIRTGCKGCPYSLQLQASLNTMQQLLPAEYEQCERIWEPVYSEYRRLNYRLSDNLFTHTDYEKKEK